MWTSSIRNTILLCLFLNSFIVAQVSNDPVMTGLFTIKVENSTMRIPHGLDSADYHAFVVETTEMMSDQIVGSGFLYRNKQGQYCIVTAAHVVETSELLSANIVAEDSEGHPYIMKLIGADTFYDIAVLEFVSSTSGIERKYCFEFSANVLVQGEGIKALGNPRGKLPNTMLKGYVTTNVGLFDDAIGGYGYFGTDLDLVPGMSGGPILNSDNQLVGICERRRTYAGTFDGVSFGLEGTIAKKAIQYLLDPVNMGRIPRAYTGLVLKQNVLRDGSFGNIEIADILPNSPAFQYKSQLLGANLKKINNTSITSLFHAISLLEKVTKRMTISIEIERGKEKSTVSILSSALSLNHLTTIAQHYFSLNPMYRIERGSWGLQLSSNDKKRSTFEFTTAGTSSGGYSALYDASDYNKLGMIVRMCSILGSVRLVGPHDVKAFSPLTEKEMVVYEKALYLYY